MGEKKCKFCGSYNIYLLSSDPEYVYKCDSCSRSWCPADDQERELDNQEATRPPAPETFTLEEIKLHKDGKRIQAIRSLRERSGCGLREAKEQSDKLAVLLGLMEEVPCAYCGGKGHTLRYKN